MRYFYHLSACPTVRDGDRVQKWIDALDPIPEAVPEAILESTAEVNRVDPKERSRYVEHPYADTNPGMDVDTHVDRSGHSDHSGPETRHVDQTSSVCLSFSPPPRQRACIVDPSKDRTALQNLAKPVSFASFGNEPDIPSDVHSLYRVIQTVSTRSGIIPKELRERVLALLHHDPPPEHMFCSGEASGMDTAEAEALLSAVCRVTRDAGESARLFRHEPGWQHFVHTPMLMLAFGAGYRSDPISNAPASDAVTARLEPVMCAAIANDSIPQYMYRHKHPPGSCDGNCNGDEGPRLAWSVVDSITPDSDDEDMMASPPHQNQKVVDYAVVLDMEDTVPLQKTIVNLIRQMSPLDDTYTHVNQTEYQPIDRNPIAVSILAGAGYQPINSLLHLGIWVAAWHKRMYYLRTWMLMFQGSITDLSQAQHPRLTTVPLIVAKGYTWDLYFAQDRGDNIIIHGPKSLGSTTSIEDTFALLKSLKAMRQWIVTDFYDGMKTWFSSEGLLAE
ncbi:hypothetical protein GGR51DRAFT_424328 [Nemania sp. FL0031]|nr:hypothetical protein GGR51DRAFT_424328 [Nemania sp. FL0031]